MYKLAWPHRVAVRLPSGDPRSTSMANQTALASAALYDYLKEAVRTPRSPFTGPMPVVDPHTTADTLAPAEFVHAPRSQGHKAAGL